MFRTRLSKVVTELGKGKTPYQALLDGGVSKMRPVSMVVLTTVLGMIPLLLDPFFGAMAACLMSGLAFAVVLCLIVRCPWWSPTKVWSLPVLFRLYRNRQGLTKGRKGHKPPPDPNHRTRPQLALEMIQLFAAWFPDRELLVTGDSA